MRPFRMMRAALVAALILPLAACLGGEGGPRLAGTPEGAQRSAAFFRGDVIVTGPPGYCVDPKSVQRKAGSGFALMASCGHLSAGPSGYVPAAVITLSILPRDGRAQMPTAARLAGPWVDVGVAQQIDGDGIALIQVERGGDSLLAAGDPRHWRGAMLINGHLIGLAVYGDAGANVAGDAGQALLLGTAKAMLAASPLRAPKQTMTRAPDPDSPEGERITPIRLDTAPAAKPVPRRGLKSIVSGLFRKPA